jgi:cytochrome c-type biogenesis protein CcmH
MSWVWIGLLALACFVVIAFALPRFIRAPRASWEALGAALLLGLAGYALQGHPGLAGAPHARDDDGAPAPDRPAYPRSEPLSDKLLRNRWMVIANALMRNGQYAEAAEVLRGAVDAEPGNSDAWMMMGNALIAHGQGSLSPAAMLAYRRAAIADPAAPGPPFFLGMALIRSGRFDEGRALWAGLLARSPADAPWRPVLTNQLARLDALLAARQGQAAAIPGTTAP